MSLTATFRRSVHDSQYCSLSYIRAKLRTRLSWASGMFLLGTLDMLVNLLNCLDLTRPDLARGLMMGPPTTPLWVTLCVFTAVGTLLYIPETINTFSVFVNDGRNFVPIHLELLITLPLEAIPLAGINYFTCRCRRNYTTGLQTMCGTFRIMFFFLRLVWHAHIQGKQLKADSTKKMYKGFFMGCCALFACMMAFPVMSWRESPELVVHDEDIESVGVYFLKAPYGDGQKVYNRTIDDLVLLAGFGREESALVPSLLEVRRAGAVGYNATYACRANTSFVPGECRHPDARAVRFTFVYYDDWPGSPYGEVRYNYGVETAAAGPGENATCSAPGTGLREGWSLFYFYTDHVEVKGRSYMRVTSPWHKTCTTTYPWYDPGIPVC